MERKQFTFYRSFFEAVSRIRRKSVRADVYDAMCRYALNGEKPDLENLPPEGAVALMLIMPVLESGMKKAVGRLNREKKEKTSCAQWEQDMGKKKESERELEIELENECKSECESEKDYGKGGGGDIADFDLFWAEYPKKVCKQEARAAFSQVTQPVYTLINAVKRQKQSEQWCREGGRFIPNPATWLNQQRWEDELPPAGGVPKGASGVLGQAELESIQRMLKEG